MSRFLSLILISVFMISCDKEMESTTEIDDANPFKDEVAFNGLTMDGSDYKTPNAFVLVWESSDTSSANFDGYFTDGEYNKLSNDLRVKEFSITVYFDLNSTSLTKLSPGVYTFENNNVRKPGIFNSSSQIRTFIKNKTEKYNITDGTVTIKEKYGFILIEYNLILNGKIEVSGQYTGPIDFIYPRSGL
jgi:hypothetical protein